MHGDVNSMQVGSVKEERSKWAAPHSGEIGDALHASADLDEAPISWIALQAPKHHAASNTSLIDSSIALLFETDYTILRAIRYDDGSERS